MAAKRALLVAKLSPHYETYAEWLEQEHELVVPPDHLQVALNKYAAFQKSDFNKEAKAARKAEAEKSAAAAKRTSRKSKAAAEDEDEDEDEEEEAPAPARKAAAKKAPPAKRTRGSSKASF